MKKSKGKSKAFRPNANMSQLMGEALPNVQKLAVDHKDSEVAVAEVPVPVLPGADDSSNAIGISARKLSGASNASNVSNSKKSADIAVKQLPNTKQSFNTKKKSTAPASLGPASTGSIKTSQSLPAQQPMPEAKTHIFAEDNMKSTNYYPIIKALARKSKLGVNFIEDFSGMTQLTDYALHAMAIHKNKAKVDKVRCVILTGCVSVTDMGLYWLAEMCPNLAMIKINGCHKITETGLHTLTRKCKNLNEVNIQGTNITILPQVAKGWVMASTGYPVISPDTKILKEKGLEILGAPNYAKPANEDLVKLCIIQGPKSKYSFIKYLKAEKTKTRDPFETLTKFKINDRFTTNIVECDECISDLVVTKRTLYMFSVMSDDDAKTRASAIFSQICHIINKVTKACFVVASFENGNEKTPLDAIMTEIGAMAKQTCVSLKKTMQEDLANATNQNPSVGTSIESQNTLHTKVVLARGLERLPEYLQSMKINVSAPCKAAEDLKPIVTGFEKVIELFPEYQEIAMPIHKFLNSDSVDKMLTGGVLATENTPTTTLKLMELFEIYGRTMCLKLLDEDTPPVCLLDWLAKVLKVAYSPNTENNARLSVLPNEALMWKYDDLHQAFQKVFPSDQAQLAAQISLRIGVSCYPSIILPYHQLPDQPVVPLENFFPEIPPFDKKSEKFYTVSYKASLSCPMTSTVFRQMIFLCSKLRRWSMAWKQGFIIHEGNVETLVEWRDQEKGEGSSISLYCHAVKMNEAQGQKLKEYVWNEAMQFKVIFDYLLIANNLPFEVTLVKGQEKGKSEEMSGTTGLLYNHPFQADVQGPILCQICGVQPKIASLPWTLKTACCTESISEEAFKEFKDTSTRQGSLLTFKNTNIVLQMVILDPNQSNRFRVQLMNKNTDGLKIGITYAVYGGLEEKNGFYLDFDSKCLVKQKVGEDDKNRPIAADKMPAIGDTITFVINSIDNSTLLVDLKVFRNTECISMQQVSNHNYMPHMQAKDTTLLLYPCLYERKLAGISLNLVPGMRLEARDKQNPHLICVATVESIKPDGKINIHFDGWTARYDYVCSTSDPDLHPIGYMQYNALKASGINQSLQAPHGYGGQFTWGNYCTEVNSLPVPYQWFSQEQRAETPSSVEIEILRGLGEKLVNSCAVVTRARVLESQTLQKCKTSTQVFDFFNEHSKYFCLLPRELNVQTLQYPSLQSVVDFTKQNVHIVCPGLKMDVLHLVDDPGVPLMRPEVMTEPQNALYLQFCIIGLLFQQGVLPQKCSKLLPGVEKLADPSQMDVWMQKLLFMYVCNLGVLMPKGKTSTASFSREAMDIFKTTMKVPQISQQFSEGDRFVRCKGHAVSSMSNSDLKEINIEECAQLFKFMTRIDFSNNQIEKIPEEFFQQLTALETLNLSKNRISVLPTGIGGIKDLSEVDLSYNKFTKLSPDFENLKSSVTYLDISHNPLDEFPAMIFKFEKLEDLNAENIGIIGDISGLKNLKELKLLNLGLNSIDNVPEELGDLQLTHLDLSGVPWVPATNYPTLAMFTKVIAANNATGRMSVEEQKKLFNKADIDASSDLSKDEVIVLNYNVLFHKYPRFGQNTLAFEKTNGIPSAIFRMKSLKKLVLRYHGIKLVPDNINELSELTDLDLSDNPYLKSLSAELAGLHLKQIHLKECVAMNTPPKEIVARGFLAVMGYLKRLKLGASPCKRTKLMMVGLGGAGKTSLVQSLMKKRYRAYMDHDEPITDGIDINTWKIPLEGTDELTYSVWDFAGQTVYYNTHQFFLSNRAVYLLLWNVRQGYEHAGLDFWLSSIACHAPKAPILVVGTHIDKVERYKLPEEALKSRYPQITGFHYVSSYTGGGVQELREMIINQTLQQKYMGEKIPEAWLTLEKRLIAHREEKNVDILPFKTLEALGAACGIFDRNELIQAVQFLHDLGAVQFFDTDFLRSMVVIYPQWIVDVMACLVTVHQGAVKDGKMMLKDVVKVWENYPTELHPWLLRLTEEFDLTCPLPDEEASIVPCLLPNSEPKFDWPHADPDKNIRESMMLYKFQYLPAGLFNRAQVRLHQYSNGALLWKTGSYMKKNKHIAVMLQTDEQEVIVRAQGFRPENFLFIVHEMFETLIMESYAGVNYDFQVPCLDCLNMNVKDPSMMSYNKVKRALELNVPFIQCEKFFHISSLEELKLAMPSDRLSNVDSHLQNSVNELKNLNQQTKISTFFVYSSKNIPDLKDVEKIVHPGSILEDLRKQDYLKISYTDKPESSDMEALTLSIKSCSVVIIGMSDEFCDNAECKKLLMYIKDVLHKPVLLLLLGTTKNWQKGDLNMAFGTEVYVDMQNKARYEHKIKELYEAIKKKAVAKKKVATDAPKCFISYCWSNSHDAIAKGSKRVEGALGWEKGDPRKVKTFLEEKGIKCWIDIERVGGVGLFHSIADGLKDAEVMLAFVSDEYVKSKNCVMEFRYGLTTLSIPVIIVVVGTGYLWERSEVGLLSVGHKCSKVNMQFDNEAGYLQLLKLAQDHLNAAKSGTENGKENVEGQRSDAFQEVLELTQRKFLRHITTSILSSDLEQYPSLILVDFITAKEKEDAARKQVKTLKKQEQAEDAEKKTDTEEQKKDDKEEKEEEVSKSLGSKYCFRYLCEDISGWHVMPKALPFPDVDKEEQQRLIEAASPYLSRLYGIGKHSKLQLECLDTPEGEIYQQRMEEIAVKASDNFKDEYLELRNTVMQIDKRRLMADLQKCQVNGKNVWLCDKHKRAARSKTEERYGDKLTTQEENIPISDMPESYATIEAETPEQSKEVRPKKMFRRNVSSNLKPGIQRQTSQMCSVM